MCVVLTTIKVADGRSGSAVLLMESRVQTLCLLEVITLVYWSFHPSIESRANDIELRRRGLVPKERRSIHKIMFTRKVNRLTSRGWTLFTL